MAAICPACGLELDVTLFQFGRAVVCDCGRVMREPSHTIELRRPAHRPDLRNPSVAPRDPRDERNQLMEELKRRAERICTHILLSDYPPVDIAVERSLLRQWCEAAFPDRMDLYDMIYESRFERLLEQFGKDREV